MKERPTIETIRLVLRPFTLADAPQVQQLAGDKEVAATLVPLPHPNWRQGYATEAAQAVLRYGFEVFELHRIHANSLTRNQASTRVLQKLGMREEGCLRQHLKH